MSTTGHESEAINVSGLKASLKKGGNIGIYNEAICSTAGGTAAKVTNTTPPSFTLTAGAKILVKFTYAISAENATLQVGSNTAKPIYYKGSALPADLVKAGTSLLLSYDGTSFNIVGDINTDTTYSVMGASGSTHASGLVPDTPSTAGTTKFLREDGTWQEPAGQNYSAGDGIDISNNEISADNTIARKTDLAPAKLGSGIGTCSTSSGTALVVTLNGYELVQNGFIAVSFEHDVPASATLNINGKGAKPIIYKGSAITADTIKADDTVMFCYNGSQYVVTSLGGGGGEVQVNEVAVISLVSDVAAHQSDLIGTTIVVTDDDTSETLLSTTWQGTPIELEVAVPTNYTVTVGASAYFTTPPAQSYSSKTTRTRNITFEYKFFRYIVDLGLPSGTMWAVGNIVSDGSGGYRVGEETDYGYYFSWGNITPHFSSDGRAFDDSYVFDDASYNSTPGSSITGSQTTGASFAPNSGYDAARELLGGSFRLPTYTEMNELYNNCTSVWTTKNGVAGREFTSNINGAKIFFPAGGYGNGAIPYLMNQTGYIWASSLYSNEQGYLFYIQELGVDPTYKFYREYGFEIRPVI